MSSGGIVPSGVRSSRSLQGRRPSSTSWCEGRAQWENRGGLVPSWENRRPIVRAIWRYREKGKKERRKKRSKEREVPTFQFI